MTSGQVTPAWLLLTDCAGVAARVGVGVGVGAKEYLLGARYIFDQFD